MNYHQLQPAKTLKVLVVIMKNTKLFSEIGIAGLNFSFLHFQQSVILLLIGGSLFKLSNRQSKKEKSFYF